MKLLAGTGFSRNAERDSNRVILNEMSANLLGFEHPENAIGKIIFRKGNNSKALEIAGVVANFHNEGLHKPIYPMIWNNNFPREFGYFSILTNTKNAQEMVKTLKTVWSRHYPKDNLNFVFANEQFNKQYESDSRFSKFYVWLTLLSIGIASVGLYGLILFYLEKKKKEISLRKVNGATIGQIISLVNFNFLKWIFASYIIAVPVAWFAMKNWLENFAYKTSLSWWIFILAGLLAFTIAFLTVTIQSFKAASKNPVESLRYE
jgi:putative ABC transport system permease protein